jgi:adenine-specific DNA-methyltransferase
MEKLMRPKQKINYRPILQTRDIKKYVLSWQGEYIPKSVFSENVLKKFEEPKKMLVARMTLQLQVAFDENKNYVGKSTVIHKIKSNINQSYLLGLLNSQLVDFWYKNYFENTHLSGGYIRFDIPYLQKIPIVVPSQKEQEIIAKFTEEVIQLKLKKIDTKKLESQIDQLIYKLYNLSKEDIKIIENIVK